MCHPSFSSCLSHRGKLHRQRCFVGTWGWDDFNGVSSSDSIKLLTTTEYSNTKGSHRPNRAPLTASPCTRGASSDRGNQIKPTSSQSWRGVPTSPPSRCLLLKVVHQHFLHCLSHTSSSSFDPVCTDLNTSSFRLGYAIQLSCRFIQSDAGKLPARLVLTAE